MELYFIHIFSASEMKNINNNFIRPYLLFRAPLKTAHSTTMHIFLDYNTSKRTFILSLSLFLSLV